MRSPHAAADALVVEHLPFAAKVAANYARRTGHPREDLEQLAAIGLIKASRRYDTQRARPQPQSLHRLRQTLREWRDHPLLAGQGISDLRARPLAGAACTGAEAGEGGGTSR